MNTLSIGDCNLILFLLAIFCFFISFYISTLQTKGEGEKLFRSFCIALPFTLGIAFASNMVVLFK